MAITLEQAKALKPGDMLHHVSKKNADGTPARYRVNGKPKIWKTRPNEVLVPVKFGWKGYDYLTERYLDNISLGDGLTND